MRDVAILRFSATEGPGYFADWLDAHGLGWRVVALDEGADRAGRPPRVRRHRDDGWSDERQRCAAVGPGGGFAVAKRGRRGRSRHRPLPGRTAAGQGAGGRRASRVHARNRLDRRRRRRCARRARLVRWPRPLRDVPVALRCFRFAGRGDPVADQHLQCQSGVRRGGPPRRHAVPRRDDVGARRGVARDRRERAAAGICAGAAVCGRHSRGYSRRTLPRSMWWPATCTRAGREG